MEDILKNNPESPMDLKGKRELLDAYRDALTSDENILEFHFQNWVNDQRMTQYLALPARFKELAKKGACMCKIDMMKYPAPTDDEIQVLREYFEKRCEILENEIAALEEKPDSFTAEPAASAAPQV